MTAEIEQTIRISPHGRTMDAEILNDHIELTRGVLGTDPDDLENALAACKRLYDDHRAFLQRLLG